MITFGPYWPGANGGLALQPPQTPYMRQSSAEGMIDPFSLQAAQEEARKRAQQEAYQALVGQYSPAPEDPRIHKAGFGAIGAPNSSIRSAAISRSGSYSSLGPGGTYGNSGGGGYAAGTNNARRGVALVGERGPELVRFNGGEQVIPNSRIRGRGGRAPHPSPQQLYDEGLMAGQLNAATGVDMEQPSGQGSAPRIRPWGGIPQPPQSIAPAAPAAPASPYASALDASLYGPATNTAPAAPTAPPPYQAPLGSTQATGAGPRYMNLQQFLASMDQTKWYALQTGQIALMDDQGNVIPGTSQYTVPYRQSQANIYGYDPVNGQQTLAAQQQAFDQEQQRIQRFGYSGMPAGGPFAAGNQARMRQAQSIPGSPQYDPRAELDYFAMKDTVLQNSPYRDALARGEDIGSYTTPEIRTFLDTQARRRAAGVAY